VIECHGCIGNALAQCTIFNAVRAGNCASRKNGAVSVILAALRATGDSKSAGMVTWFGVKS
jgi:hypothetical protein